MDDWSRLMPIFRPVLEVMPLRVSGLKNDGPVLGAAAIFNSREKEIFN
jgi:hypothetical protein